MTTYIVSSAFDSGFGTLRQAILDANASPGADQIDILGVMALTLSSALPTITEDLRFSSAADISSSLSASAHPTLDIGAGATVTMAGGGTIYPITVTGAGRLLFNSGTSLIMGDLNHTGGTTVDSATLAIGNLTQGSISGDVELVAGAALTFHRTDAYTYSGDISGRGSVWQSGSSTLFLSGTNTFDGQLVLQAGRLQLRGGSAVPDASSITLNAGTILQVADPETIGGLSDWSPGVAGIVDLGGVNLVINGGGGAVFSGGIEGTGSLVKSGSGTQTLAGVNTYFGSTYVDQGTLRLVDGGTIPASTIVVSSGATLAFDRSDTATFTGNITGGGGFGKTGPGTLTLSGSNTYSGATAIDGGTLIASGGGAIGNNSAVSVAALATLRLSANETVGSLAGAGWVELNSYTLTAGGNNGSTAFSGVISGAGQFIKAGSGTLTLSGANTYSGATIISAGTLVAASGAAISNAGAVTVAAGATLRLDAHETIGTLAGAGSVDLASRNLTVDGAGSTAFSGAIGGAGALIKTGAGTLTLSGTNTYAGGTVLSVGTLAISGGAALADTGAVVVGSSATLQVDASETIGALSGAGAVVLNADLRVDSFAGTNVSGAISGAGGLVMAGGGMLTLSGANTYAGPTTVSAGTLGLSGGAALADAGAVTVEAGASLWLNASETIGSLAGAGSVDLGANDLTLGGNGVNTTFSGVATGAGRLVKTGAGTLTLSGANTNGGAQVSDGVLRLEGGAAIADDQTVALQGGTLELGADETVAAVSGLSGAVHLGAHTLTMAGASPLFLVGLTAPISGTGGLVKAGAFQIQLAGANTYTGGTTIDGGTLSVSGGAALADAGAVTVNAGGLLQVLQSETIGALSGAGGAAIGAGQVLTVDAATASTFAGGAVGAGGLVKAGSGTLTLSGTSTYTGATSVLDGTLTVDGALASAVTVQAGAALGGAGSVGGLTVLAGGTLSPGNSPGTLNVNGGLTLAAGATLAAEIAGAASHDKLVVVGGVDLGGATLDLSLLGGFAPGAGAVFTVIDNDGADAVTGTFDGLAESAIVSVDGQDFVLSYRGGDGNDVTLTAYAPPVEEELPTPTPVELMARLATALGLEPDLQKALDSVVVLPDGSTVPNPNFETAVQLAGLSSQVQLGLIGHDALVQALTRLALATTAVAAESYQFFTGALPTQAGLAWLVDSPDNAADLTDPYYLGFNPANRYLKFAVNLGVHGEGQGAFAAQFGALGFEAAVRKAYDMIVGVQQAQAGGVDVDAAVAWLVGQQGYFDAVGGSDLGGKAAMVGYVLYAGMTAEVGRYYEAMRGFVGDLYDGDAAFGVGLAGLASLADPGAAYA